ncbi:uncharacterized protein LOC143598034 [Bidens hawaiensis]|uniref:uncharacterized protein LOC143598034 n=1 Tax=Bidens hawaiensis TaxID=980011 RepID=UPI0040497071
MTSSQTGQAWIMEVLKGNPIRCVNAFRMHPNVFMKLRRELESNYGLQSSDRMPTFEKVGIFLYTLALGLSNRDVGERFQRSGESISRAFHEVLEAITGRDKGFQGRYYLVDKGYPGRNGYLVPYSKTRYHQSQFQREPPNNMQEAFNRSHSSLCSYIERSFGILKKRFKILGTMPKYSVHTQIDVIMATFALHNYIRNCQDDILFTTMEQRPNYIPRDELDDISNHETNANGLFEGTTNEMKQVRNNIATLIWNA